MVVVREASSGHVEGICRVCAAGWRDAYADVLPSEYVEANVRTFYVPERVEREVRESGPTERWLVAVLAGENRDDIRVVGAARDHRPESSVGEVFVLYVHPERQGEGIGSQLLDALTVRHRERGATEQRVDVFADHDAAIGFYEAKGFEVREEFPAATVDGVDPECETVQLSRSIRASPGGAERLRSGGPG